MTALSIRRTALCALLCAAGTAHANLLTNGSFERGDQVRLQEGGLSGSPYAGDEQARPQPLVQDAGAEKLLCHALGQSSAMKDPVHWKILSDINNYVNFINLLRNFDFCV